MVKRAALARALALDPRILFLDEPTSDLDPLTASGIDTLIRELNRSLGITVVVVTHDLTTLFSVCGRIAVLVGGRSARRHPRRADALEGAVDPRIPRTARARRRRALRGGRVMETDRHYFIEGLFVIGISVAAVLFFVWLTQSGHRDDVLYRIRFAESVSGLALGDPVKFRGVDIGTVKAMEIDASDPRTVQVDVNLRKDAPIKTDTRAMLKLKGFTGVVFIELNGGSPNATSLSQSVTPEGRCRRIGAEKSKPRTTVIDQLPKVIEKFTAIEDQSRKVFSDVNSVTTKIKENPSVLIFPPKDKDKTKENQTERNPGARR